MKNEEIEILNFDDEIDYKNKKKKVKKKLNKKEKIFIIGNIFIILIIIGVYLYRGIHYYKVMNVDILKTTLLVDKITNIKNIVYSNDGLYKDDDGYYFKGSDVNNYILFEGRLWQIVSITDSIKIISKDNISSLVYGVNSEYYESNIYKWLTNYQETIKDQHIYLTNSSWCNESVDANNYNCLNTKENNIGLLTIDEYMKAGANNSYLNNNEYWWTINYDSSNNAYYVNDKGQINNSAFNGDYYLSLGIRPVINLLKDVVYASGDGTIDNPYTIEINENALLKEHYVGSYVKYNDYLFRILKIDDNGIELILDNLLENKSTFNNLENYLNKEFIQEFNLNDLVKMDYYFDEYNLSNSYNYQEHKNKKSNYIKIPSIGEYFITNDYDYWLNNIYNSNENLYYIILENNTYSSDLKNNSNGVKPIIKVRNDLIIQSGVGTVESPLIIGDQNEKN